MKGVTVAQTVVASEQRHAALPAELAGSLVLAAADALASLSLRVLPQELVLLEDGTVRVCGGIPTDEASAERSLRSLLDRVLLSSSSVTPGLLRAARRPNQGGVSDLVRELEVALIPTNRGAARRALARLCREVAQAIRQFPQLQQAADAIQITETNVIAQPLVVASFAPPAVTVMEPSILEEWIDVSPVFPEIIPGPEPREVVAEPRDVVLEIPDLEIPGAAKPQDWLVQAHWQPVEHTQKLSPASAKAPTPPSKMKAPSKPPASPRAESADRVQAKPAEIEYIELSDDDLHEVTAELKVEPPIALMPPSPASTHGCAEYQTAEPFLLVLPALGQAVTMPAEPSPVETVVPALDAATVPAELSPVETVVPVLDAASIEPCAGEAEDTVLDAVTFIEEERMASSERLPRLSHIDAEVDDEMAQFAEGSGGLPPFESIEEAEPVLGPHSYLAQPRFARGIGSVNDRIAQFSVAPLESSEQLTRGLRNLAGIDHDAIAEPSKTPPPTAYAAESPESERSAPSGAFVRTLIGLGATGMFIVLGHLTWGRVTPVSAAAVSLARVGSACRATLKITDVPVGTTIHVNQAGSYPKSELTQVGPPPFKVDGLACGEPAELLVKLSDRGWYRIPIEGDRLTAAEDSEPIRIAAYLGR